MGEVFAEAPDKAQAQQDLQRLALDRDGDVIGRAAYDLGKAFSQVPDKAQAQQVLHKLTLDNDSNVKGNAAFALGKGFSLVHDKVQAQQDLQRLTQDGYSSVRMFAYHSLGMASVFAATEAKDKFTSRRELEAAIAYFEKSSQESNESPARFCYPFYRTYYAITFEEAKEVEVQKYLAEAKEAVKGSESKDELLKAVKNLARALQESKMLNDRNLDDIKRDLNAYRWYCEKAAEHMKSAEDKAPGAVKLMIKFNPLLEERIKATIAEIQKKAGLISPEVDQAARCLSMDDPIKVYKCCMRMASALRDSCKRLPEEKNDLTCGALEDIEKEDEVACHNCCKFVVALYPDFYSLLQG